MNALPSSTVDPETLATEALRAVLRTQWDGMPVVRLDSPPGAGKTGIVERLAAQALGRLGQRCAIATPTNEQSFDLARRLAMGFPRLTFVLWVSSELQLPADLVSLGNLRIVEKPVDLPTGPCVVLANAAKWSWIRGDVPTFDVLIVDEAFQLPDYRFQLIAGIARRYVLVGDPGQIAPVVTCSLERWRCNPAGPHVACPEALVHRHPGVTRLALPVSRRLPADTVAVIQPAFYPALPFRALSAAEDRALLLPAQGLTAVDRLLDAAARGNSLVLGELPARATSEVDEDLAAMLVASIERLFARAARVRDGGSERALRAEDVGVVCAHVTQVNAVRERLGPGLQSVLVETAERFQGLERAVMFVHHPLSGRAEFGSFQLDAGRLCVMTSRHRVACFVLARAELDSALEAHAPSGERILGIERDHEHEGWRAHRTLLAALSARRARVSLG